MNSCRIRKADFPRVPGNGASRIELGPGVFDVGGRLRVDRRGVLEIVGSGVEATVIRVRNGRGLLVDGDLAGLRQMKSWKDEPFRKAVTEDVARAWYKGSGPVSPFVSDTVPDYTDWKADDQYSWVKAPRYDGQPMEVGPLSQVLMGFATGDPFVAPFPTRDRQGEEHDTDDRQRGRH